MDLNSMTSSESRYVLICHSYGLFRFKIPDDHKQLESEEVELAWGDIASIKTMMGTMGMFKNGGCIYFVGGHEFTISARLNTQEVHVYNPSAHQSTAMTCFTTAHKYQPIVKPTVFRVKEQTYLLTLLCDSDAMWKRLFSFLSFDPTLECFRPLNTPNLSFDKPDSFFAVGHFIVFDYIYLFIQEHPDDEPQVSHFAFSFDTRSKKWEKLDSLCSAFINQGIPFPVGHSGDTAISDAFDGNDRILVALAYGKPTAYRVSVDEAGGSLQIKSHRLLVDYYCTLEGRFGIFNYDSLSCLLGLGDGKFCVVYSSPLSPLLAYIFKMDFKLEYEQNYSKSVVVLSSKKFKRNAAAFLVDRASSACSFSYAPPTSLENVEVDHNKQHDEPVKMEEYDDDNGVVYDKGVPYVKDFTRWDRSEMYAYEGF